MFIVSSVIPKKVSYVEGPSIFSIARRMPSSWQMCLIDSRLAWQILVAGGPNVRKSSK